MNHKEESIKRPSESPTSFMVLNNDYHRLSMKENENALKHEYDTQSLKNCKPFGSCYNCSTSQLPICDIKFMMMGCDVGVHSIISWKTREIFQVQKCDKHLWVPWDAINCGANINSSKKLLEGIKWNNGDPWASSFLLSERITS